MRRALGSPVRRTELVFVEATSGLVQTVALNPFDEALVTHQLEVVVAFLDARRAAAERRRHLLFTPPFPALRPGQETIQQDLAAAFRSPSGPPHSALRTPQASVVLLEAPTGYGKTGCGLEFALTQLRGGRFDRLIWLTGKATGQIQVVETLRRMTAGAGGLPHWHVRNKAEHCVNEVFHCVRDACAYLAGAVERWPGSGLARFTTGALPEAGLEDFRAAGREARICPYEITRAALAAHDVWIGDYNYVFAPDVQGLFAGQPGFDPARTLLVVDEAHNLPSRVADAHSHTVDDTAARALYAELDHLRAPAALLLALEGWIRALAHIAPCAALDPVHEADLRDALDRLVERLMAAPPDPAALGPRLSETLWNLPRLAAALADTRLPRLLWARHPGELSVTCLDAAPAIGDILRTYGGVVLMSATLAPFDTSAAACGLEAGQWTSLRAEAPWRRGAFDVAVDRRVATTLRERAAHHGTTAETVERMAAAAGGPVAAFFPSYAYAEAVRQALENAGSPLRVALQPRLPGLAEQEAWVEESLAFADALFLVLGSSFAEGIDLLGGRVTHALVVGPALPEVNAVQQARLGALGGLGRDAAFRRVYQIPGLQKVNQALGRLVRAPGHRAKVLLHCRRFADPAYASLLDPECQFYRELASTADLDAWLAGD
jgi:Rad3-related DNA helicase